MDSPENMLKTMLEFKEEAKNLKPSTIKKLENEVIN